MQSRSFYQPVRPLSLPSDYTHCVFQASILFRFHLGSFIVSLFQEAEARGVRGRQRPAESVRWSGAMSCLSGQGASVGTRGPGSRPSSHVSSSLGGLQAACTLRTFSQSHGRPPPASPTVSPPLLFHARRLLG